MKNKENCLFGLQQWYIERCNGNWESQFGIKIETIDNPGWSIHVNLTDTPLESEEFKDLRLEIDENDWVICWVKEAVFQGGGGGFKAY